MKPRYVIVLDDMTSRIKWLHDALAGTGVNIAWADSVAEFRRALADHPRPALIILDHDLGPESTTSEDANGETGLDGATAIPASTSTPIMIWSQNDAARKKMADVLRSRGVIASIHPFDGNKFQLMQTVLQHVTQR